MLHEVGLNSISGNCGFEIFKYGRFLTIASWPQCIAHHVHHPRTNAGRHPTPTKQLVGV